MGLEIARLCLGLLIAGFHAPITDFVLEQEAVLMVALRRHGLDLPTAISRKAAQNLFFCFGISIVLLQLVRIYSLAS